MKVGIVGLPNAGKSSLFNALSKAGAEAANYPFTTIEPNIAILPVRDDRLDEVARTVGASDVVPDTIQVHDIAGLVRGAHEGEGLGNQFLANIRETDAILHVVRAHEDPNVIHPEVGEDQLGLDRVHVRRRVDAAVGVDHVRVVMSPDHMQQRVGLPDVGQELVAEALALVLSLIHI